MNWHVVLTQGTSARPLLPGLGALAAGARPPASRRWLTNVAALGLATGLFALYAAISLRRDAHLGTAGYDLGIFDQAVQSLARLRAPMTELMGPGFDFLGEHFSPILATLVPFYWIWPAEQTLLIAQAAVIAFSAVPLVRVVARRVNLGCGLAVGLAYGLSWGIQGAVVFDFHEVIFALPLLALSLAALTEQRWTAGLLWAMPLTLVKEDLGVTVAAIGCYLLLKRRWVAGAIGVAYGFGAFLFSTLVLIPALDHMFHTYRFWGVVTKGPGNTAGAPTLAHVWHLLTSLPSAAMTPSGKLWLVFWALAVTAFLALRSPLILIAAPTVAWRLLATNPEYWDVSGLHYNAVLMPIVFFALADTLGRLRAGHRLPPRLSSGLASTVVLAVALVALPRFGFWQQLTHPPFPSARHVAAAKQVASLVPGGARTQASNYLVPLVVDRCRLTTLFPDVHNRPVEYVLVDTTALYGVPYPHDRQEAALRALPGQGFHLIAERDGIQLYRRQR